jgi:ABC-type multidrug transport system ATPase subunit
MLTTMLLPPEGGATVASFDPRMQGGQVRRHIGYVSQRLRADGEPTGDERLRLSARLDPVPRAEREDRMRAALGLMGLTEVRAWPVRQCSGDMIRRLEIAQRILHAHRSSCSMRRPNGSTRSAGMRSGGPSVRCARLGAAVRVTTHDMDEADARCDPSASIDRGRILVTDTPSTLKGQIGEYATLDDVFAQMTGQAANDGNVRDVGRRRHVAREHAWPDTVQSPMVGTLTRLRAVADAELRKLRHDRSELASRAIQPVLWLMPFGNAMARVRGPAHRSYRLGTSSRRAHSLNARSSSPSSSA